MGVESTWFRSSIAQFELFFNKNKPLDKGTDEY